MTESYLYELFRQDAMETARKVVMESALKEGLEQGRHEGLKQGRHEGAVLNMRNAILNALRVRFQEVSPAKCSSNVWSKKVRSTSFLRKPSQPLHCRSLRTSSTTCVHEYRRLLSKSGYPGLKQDEQDYASMLFRRYPEHPVNPDHPDSDILQRQMQPCLCHPPISLSFLPAK